MCWEMRQFLVFPSCFTNPLEQGIQTEGPGAKIDPAGTPVRPTGQLTNNVREDLNFLGF